MIFNNLLICLAAARLVAGHGAIIKAVGNKGGSGNALGIVDSTPRDGSRRDPFQLDSTVFDGSNADVCGETPGGGPNNLSEQISKVISKNNGLPKVSPGGLLTMTLHQVDLDGAGPYECMIDSSGTGASGWAKMDVLTNVPGRRSRSRARATDFPLAVKVSDDQKCTGNANNIKNICVVRCQNAGLGGPYGGCIPFTLVGEDGAAQITENTGVKEEAEDKKADEQKASSEEKDTQTGRVSSEFSEGKKTPDGQRAAGKNETALDEQIVKGKETAGASREKEAPVDQGTVRGKESAGEQETSKGTGPALSDGSKEISGMGLSPGTAGAKESTGANDISGEKEAPGKQGPSKGTESMQWNDYFSEISAPENIKESKDTGEKEAVGNTGEKQSIDAQNDTTSKPFEGDDGRNINSGSVELEKSSMSNQAPENIFDEIFGGPGANKASTSRKVRNLHSVRLK